MNRAAPKIRIGIITDAIDDNAGGIKFYVEELVKNLLLEDKKNKYCMVHYKKSDDPFYKGKEEIIIPIPNIPFGREIRKIWLMPKILEEHRLDLVHETAQMGPFFRKSSFEKVVTIHDLSAITHPKTHSFFTYIHHKTGMPFMIRRTDKIIAVSEHTAQDIIRLFGVNKSKVDVTLEACSDNFFLVPKKKVDRFKKQNGLKDYIFFVGSIEPRKNLITMLSAFIEIKKKEKKKDLQFVIATRKGWKNEEVFDLIERSGFKDSIKIIYGCNDSFLNLLFNGAKAHLFVSLYEGFGLSVLQAMRCGCPVITSAGSSMGEIAKNAAILIKDPKNKEEITAAIKLILYNETIRKEIIQKGFMREKEFSWKKCAKETLHAYEDVMKNKNKLGEVVGREKNCG